MDVRTQDLRAVANRGLKRAAVAVAPPVRRLVADRDRLSRENNRLRARLREYRSPRGREGEAVRQDGTTGYEYLFVMTYGRSGSTLLQAILNTVPGMLVRGENHALPYHLHRFHQSAVRDAAWVGRPGSGKAHPFFGIRDYPADTALAGIRGLLLDTVLRPGPGTRVVGFKEIRWYQDDLADYVRFLTEVFPGARFVVNTRRLADVARSGWWAERDDAGELLERIEARMLEVAEGLGPHAYRVRYEDYTADPSTLQGLFDWLGEEWDEDRVRRAMQRQYAPLPPRRSDSS